LLDPALAGSSISNIVVQGRLIVRESS